MGTEITKKANLGALASGLKHARKQAPSVGGKAYLRFTKGDWGLGKEKVDVADEVVIFNTSSLRTGYECWTDYTKAQLKARKAEGKSQSNELLGEEMELATSGGVDPDDLPDMGDWEWTTVQQIEGRFVNNDQREFIWTARSYGGLKAMGMMVDEILSRMSLGEEEFLMPVVRLETSSYDNKTYGEVHEPVLTIVDWANIDGDREGAEEEPEVAPEPAPKAAAKRTAKPKPAPAPEPEEVEDEAEEEAEEEVEEQAEEEVEDEAPVRRRRVRR